MAPLEPFRALRPILLIPILSFAFAVGSETCRLEAGQDIVVSIDDLEALPGTVASADVTIANSLSPLDGWSFGICHDPAVVTAVDLSLGAGIPAPDFLSQQVHAGGVTQVVVLDFTLLAPLPLGTEVLLHIDYSVVGTVGESTTLGFCGTLSSGGAPPVLVRFLDGSTPLPHTCLDGSLTIVDCLAISDLACDSIPGGDLALSWSVHPEYDTIDVLRDGVVIANLPGTATAFTDSAGPGRYEYTLRGTCGANVVLSNVCIGHVVEFIADTVTAVPGGPATVPVLLDLRGGEVHGFAFGIAHDPTRLTALGATATGSLAALRSGAGPDVLLVQTFSSGLTLGMLIATAEPFEVLLPPLAGAEAVIDVLYEVEPGVSGVTPLTFSDQIGAPPVLIEVVIDLLTVFPLTTAGSVEIVAPAGVFLRGDVNGTGTRDLTDVIQLMLMLFAPDPSLPILCEDALDVNDDGELSLVDAIHELSYLFAGSAPPPPPFETCESDGTGDLLTCENDLCTT